MKKILLIRMDRIGDLILTLPVDSVVKSTQITWIISKGLEFVAKNTLPKRNYLSFEKKFSLKTFILLVKEVRKIKPDAAVIFHAPSWVSVALWIAGVPVRAGKKSKLDSFIFLNKGIRQKRSNSKKHEMHYNLDLITEALDLEKLPFEQLKPLQIDTPLMDIQLAKWDLKKHEYIVVHPGMGGSALNWSMTSYSKFIDIVKQKVKVVVTGSVVDRVYVDELKKIQNQSKDILWLDEKLTTDELFLILKYARAALVPSTGVIHMAASLGTPVLGLYSPRRVETALRWGPCGKKVKTLTPELQKNEDLDSIFDNRVMERMSPQYVANEFFKLME